MGFKLYKNQSTDLPTVGNYTHQYPEFEWMADQPFAFFKSNKHTSNQKFYLIKIKCVHIETRYILLNKLSDKKYVY